MRLQLVLRVVTLLDSGVEAVVDRVEHAPHLVGARSQQRINFTPSSFARLSLPLRASDVLLRESHPRERDGDAVNE